MQTKPFMLGAVGFIVCAGLFTVTAPQATRAAVATLVQVVNTNATPVPVTAPTHYGQPILNSVMLQLDSTSPNFPQRQYPDGTLSPAGWTVPAGMALVITDYEIFPYSTPCGSGALYATSTSAPLDVTGAIDSGGFASRQGILVVINEGLQPTIQVSTPSGCRLLAHAHGYLTPKLQSNWY